MRRSTPAWVAKHLLSTLGGVMADGLDLSGARSVVTAVNRAGSALEIERSLAVLEHDGGGLLDQVQMARAEKVARVRLYEAAEGLLSALDELVNDDDLWDALGASEGAMTSISELTPRQEMQLREILTHEIPTLLKHLGYQTPPPPPAEQWAEWMQAPLSDLLSSNPDECSFSRRAAIAQDELVYFLMRFRRLLREARMFIDIEDEVGGDQEDPLMRRVLAAGVTAARTRAVPAAIGAGIGGFVAGPVGAYLGAGAGGASAELVKTVLEAVSVAALSGRVAPGPTTLPESVSERSTDACRRLESLLFEWASVELLPESQASQLAFLTRRSVFEILQSSSPEDVAAAWVVSRRLFVAIDQKDLSQMLESAEELIKSQKNAANGFFLQYKLRLLEEADERQRQYERAERDRQREVDRLAAEAQQERDQVERLRRSQDEQARREDVAEQKQERRYNSSS